MTIFGNGSCPKRSKSVYIAKTMKDLSKFIRIVFSNKQLKHRKAWIVQL